MDLINEPVIHRKFGKGRITSLEGGYVEITFSAENSSKKFRYPEAFEQFLTAVGMEAGAFICSELEMHKKTLQAEHAAKLEADRRREEQRQATRTAAAKPKSAKKAKKPVTS